MDDSGRSRSSSSRPIRTVALNALILILCFAVLELGVRMFADLGKGGPRPARDLDLDKKISFLPGRAGTYETSEFHFTLSTNSYGRRDIEWTASMFADPENILFIGDSMVLGYGVEHEWTIPTLLETRFGEAGRPYEVFNFGLPGGSPPDYKLLLDEAFRLGVEARRILLGITVGNDFYPSVVAPLEARWEAPSRRHGWRKRSALVTFLEFRASHSARFVGWMLTVSRLLGVTMYDTAGSYVFLRKQTPEQRALFQRILSIVEEIKESCDANGRDLYLVIFPNKIQVENTEDLTNSIYDAEQPNRLILGYCEELGLSCLDLLPHLTATYVRSKHPLYFPVDRHLTERGSEIVADAIVEFLEQSDVHRRKPLARAHRDAAALYRSRMGPFT